MTGRVPLKLAMVWGVLTVFSSIALGEHGVARDQVAVVGDVVGKQSAQPLHVVAPVAVQFAGSAEPAHQLHAGLQLMRSEEHTSELSHQIISYAVFCLKKKNERYTI